MTRAACAALFVMLLAWAPGSAWAVEGCEPLDEPEFRSLVLDAQAAIDRGNLELPGQILEEIEARVPCLVFAPAPRMWADLLVAKAIVSFLHDSGGDGWKHALQAALRIRPMVDRGVSSAHPMASWDPADDPEFRPPSSPPIVVPEGKQIYVDGIPEKHVPSSGTVLVQRTDGTWWNSILVDEDEPLPVGWLSEEVEQPRRIVLWARTAVTTGVGAALQTPSWGSDVFVERTSGGASAGVAGDLHLTLFSPAGFWISGGASPAVQTAGLHLRVAAIWTVGGLTMGLGGGTASVDTYEQGQVIDEDGADADEDGELLRRMSLLRYPLATAMYRSRGPWSVDGSLAVGASPSLTRVDLQAGLAPPRLFDQRFRFGVDVSLGAGRLIPQGLPQREVVASNARVLLRIGLIWGEY